jgi:hypothetical protein
MRRHEWLFVSCTTWILERPGEIPAVFHFEIVLNRLRRHFLMMQSSNFLISADEKLSHCDTEPDFQRRDGRKKLASMISIHVSHRVESATCVTLLTNIFWTAETEKMVRDRNFSARSKKTARLSVYGEAPIQPDLLKNSAESNYLSVHGQSVRHLACLPVVRELGAIHQMLTAYCRITQSGSKETSTTITNTDDRYAQSLGSKTSLRCGALTTNS